MNIAVHIKQLYINLDYMVFFIFYSSVDRAVFNLFIFNSVGNFQVLSVHSNSSVDRAMLSVHI